MYDRILGRTTLHDIYHSQTGKFIATAGEELTESVAQLIEDSPIEEVEIRSAVIGDFQAPKGAIVSGI